MRRRSLVKLAAMRSAYDRYSSEPAPMHVYEAKDVELRIGGVLIDLDAMSTIDISRRPASEPRYGEVTMTLTQTCTVQEMHRVINEGHAAEQRARERGELTEIMSESEARRRGIDVDAIPPYDGCMACDIGSDGSGALDPSHSLGEGCALRSR